MEKNGNSPKKSQYIQITLNFPALFTTSAANSNNVKNISSNTKVQLRQITLNFPLDPNNTRKKRSFGDIDSDNNNDTDNDDDESDNFDEYNDNEYNELPLDGEPHMCYKEKKLR